MAGHWLLTRLPCALTCPVCTHPSLPSFFYITFPHISHFWSWIQPGLPMPEWSPRWASPQGDPLGAEFCYRWVIFRAGPVWFSLVLTSDARPQALSLPHPAPPTLLGRGWHHHAPLSPPPPSPARVDHSLEINGNVLSAQSCRCQGPPTPTPATPHYLPLGQDRRQHVTLHDRYHQKVLLAGASGAEWLPQGPGRPGQLGVWLSWGWSGRGELTEGPSRWHMGPPAASTFFPTHPNVWAVWGVPSCQPAVNRPPQGHQP